MEVFSYTGFTKVFDYLNYTALPGLNPGPLGIRGEHLDFLQLSMTLALCFVTGQDVYPILD